jgi:hypothetical protein
MIADNPPALDDPLTSHCAWCGDIHWLTDLEMIKQEPAGGQLRCRTGTGCQGGSKVPPGGVALIEDLAGNVRLEEGALPATRGRFWRKRYRS